MTMMMMMKSLMQSDKTGGPRATSGPITPEPGPRNYMLIDSSSSFFILKYLEK
jgi:hypothetical protein